MLGDAIEVGDDNLNPQIDLGSCAGTSSGIPDTPSHRAEINPTKVVERLIERLGVKIGDVFACFEEHKQPGSYHIHWGVEKSATNAKRLRVKKSILKYIIYGKYAGAGKWTWPYLVKMTDKRGWLKYCIKRQGKGVPKGMEPVFAELGLDGKPIFVDILVAFKRMVPLQTGGSKQSAEIVRLLKEGQMTPLEILEKHPSALQKLPSLLKAYNLFQAPVHTWKNSTEIPIPDVNALLGLPDADAHVILVKRMNALRATMLTGKPIPPGFQLILIGPSETHKSSFFFWLAKEHGFPIHVWSMTAGGFTGESLASIRRGDQPMVILETFEPPPQTLGYSELEMMMDRVEGHMLNVKQSSYVFPRDRFPVVVTGNIHPNLWYKGRPIYSEATGKTTRVDLLSPAHRAALTRRVKDHTLVIQTPLNFFPNPQPDALFPPIPMALNGFDDDN